MRRDPTRAVRRLLAAGAVVPALMHGSPAPLGRSLSPSAYFHEAVGFLKTTAIYTPTGGWSATLARADEMAANQSSDAGVHAAIDEIVAKLVTAGDGHASFASASARQQLIARGEQGAVPAVRRLAASVGYISLPEITAAWSSPLSRKYIATALEAIKAIDAHGAPCGWIVDLRSDTGGTMLPMLVSLSQLLPSGRILGFKPRNKPIVWQRYGAGRLVQGAQSYRVPEWLAATKAPVAVLIGPNTASAGEATAIAFVGRQLTRSFGQQTMGLANAPKVLRLPDGWVLQVSAASDVARTGRVYGGAVAPDQTTAPGFGPAMRAARTWLFSTASCSSAVLNRH